MPNKKYISGTRFELKIRNMVRELGYYASRTPGSKTKVDVFVVEANTGRVIFVQCKNKGDISIAEWNEFFNLSKLYKATPVLAWNRGRGDLVIEEILGPAGHRNRPRRDFRF